MWSIILYLVLLPLTSNGQCHLPTVADIERELNVLLTVADGEGLYAPNVSSYNYTCLAQGSTRDTYRRVSIIATFTPNSGADERREHFQLTCNINNIWSAVTDEGFDTPPSNPIERRDCFTCASERFANDSNHCLGEVTIIIIVDIIIIL